jgi:hypothetical protein
MDHPDYGRVNYTAVELSQDPDEQVAQTIGYMADMVRADSGTRQVSEELQLALDRSPGAAVCDAIWAHVKGRLTFQRDEQTGSHVRHGIPGGIVVETLVRPRDMAMGNGVGSQRGDCDDFSMLTASLLERAGIAWKFATIAVDDEDPSVFSHVYVVAYPGGSRYPMDTSHGKHPGWEHPAPFRREEWGGDCGLWKWAALAVAGYLAFKFIN